MPVNDLSGIYLISNIRQIFVYLAKIGLRYVENR
jgi:hypothetical protein